MTRWFELPRQCNVISLSSSIYSPSTTTSHIDIMCCRIAFSNGVSDLFWNIYSHVYPVYNQMVLFGNETRISLINFSIFLRFFAYNGSPPLKVIPLIYVCSNSFKISFSAFASNIIPFSGFHVCGF